MERSSKVVVRVNDADIQLLQLRLRSLAHELVLWQSNGTRTRFLLMNRREAAPSVPLLEGRFGERLEVSMTRTYAFFERHAPFLNR